MMADTQLLQHDWAGLHAAAEKAGVPAMQLMWELLQHVAATQAVAPVGVPNIEVQVIDIVKRHFQTSQAGQARSIPRQTPQTKESPA